MIPNFKTYITEGVWGNISKRAEGTQDRKEDNIDNMDISEFYNYLKNTYSFLGDSQLDWLTKDYDDTGENVYEIWIPLVKPNYSKVGAASYYIVYDYYDKTLTVSTNLETDFPELCKLLNDEFTMSECSNRNGLVVIGKEKRSKYSFVVNVMDFILKCKIDQGIMLFKRNDTKF